ncbi:hypothetical protein GNF76_28615 [Pseudomonas sp. CCM 7893]|uniref:VOC domain-containing protein n=1 Tax=Pseudomonas spelaei TaxID=1055469 RepID=A0A6I3WJB3_9PSED|nr:hypothetical protein [Pseudomonas spelaei]MUF08301.1 hypothetical protein [Pseudomonas spelaei]
MLHHIEIHVANLSVSLQFWSGLLAQIGYRENGKWNNGFTLAYDRVAYLTFVQVSETHAFQRYRRCGAGLNHLAFKVKDRDTVDKLRLYCMANGIVSLYDQKSPFANDDTDYYALFIEAPDSIKVEFIADDLSPL